MFISVFTFYFCRFKDGCKKMDHNSFFSQMEVMYTGYLNKSNKAYHTVYYCTKVYSLVFIVGQKCLIQLLQRQIRSKTFAAMIEFTCRSCRQCLSSHLSYITDIDSRPRRPLSEDLHLLDGVETEDVEAGGEHVAGRLTQQQPVVVHLKEL